jgi:hypothetical protein
MRHEIHRLQSIIYATGRHAGGLLFSAKGWHAFNAPVPLSARSSTGLCGSCWALAQRQSLKSPARGRRAFQE